MYLLVTGLQSVIFAAVAAWLIFGLAGRWDLWNVWVYVGILLVRCAEIPASVLDEQVARHHQHDVGWQRSQA